MKRIICLTALIAFFGLCFGSGEYDTLDCKKDVKDQRGKMKPWKKGAWKTGRYRNVFSKTTITVYSNSNGVITNVLSATTTVPAESAGDMAFNGNPLAKENS